MRKSSDITLPLRVANMLPLDYKSVFLTLEEMADLGDDYEKAFTYYEGMKCYCVENKQTYVWQEQGISSIGVLEANFIYPPGTVVEGVDYSEKSFNFNIDNSSGGESFKNLHFLEPSVNVEIKDDPIDIEQAMHFGNINTGGGAVDIGLVKPSFVPQSGYNILSNKKIGDQIKIFNATTLQYLGHFEVTGDLFSGYRILTAIEKGDWSVEGVFEAQKIIINVLEESEYSILLWGQNMVLRKGTQQIGSVNLGPLISVGSVTIVSGALNSSTGIVTFTLSDASTFDVDFSELINAADNLSKDGNIAVKGKDIYQNIFVSKASMLFEGGGFYSADLTTNYNSGNFGSFPYPSNRRYVMCVYNGITYLLVKRNDFATRRIFNDPNSIIGVTAFKYNDNTDKSMRFLAYFKILSRKTLLTGLNADYDAYPVYNTVNNVIPQSNSTGNFDETRLTEVNEPTGCVILNLVSNEKMSLKKSVTAPYTLTEADNGRILHVSGSGTITIPQLNYGFECGFIQESADENNIGFIGASGVTLQVPSNKLRRIYGQYHCVYLLNNHEYSPTAVLPSLSTNYILTGTLADS